MSSKIPQPAMIPPRLMLSLRWCMAVMPWVFIALRLSLVKHSNELLGHPPRADYWPRNPSVDAWTNAVIMTGIVSIPSVILVCAFAAHDLIKRFSGHAIGQLLVVLSGFLFFLVFEYSSGDEMGYLTD